MKPTSIRTLTSDINALKRGLSHIDFKGTTALYDAVAASADELSSHAKQPKQVLLIITDGEDNASRLSSATDDPPCAEPGGPVVYSIGLLFGEESKEKSDRARGSGDAVERDRRPRIFPTFHAGCE